VHAQSLGNEVAEASAVQPFAYLQLPFAAIIGLTVFGEELKPNVALGAGSPSSPASQLLRLEALRAWRACAHHGVPLVSMDDMYPHVLDLLQPTAGRGSGSSSVQRLACARGVLMRQTQTGVCCRDGGVGDALRRHLQRRLPDQ
jgi:hypothetical protein